MKRKYTFIVGAGASVEFGFPVGSELTSSISDLLNLEFDELGDLERGDEQIAYCLRRIPYPVAKKSWNTSYLYRAANEMSQNMGLAPSIDNYLEAKKDSLGYSEIGKIAIARAILQHEKNSALWFDRRTERRQRPDFARMPPNWLTNLFQTLVSQNDLDNFRRALKSCSFVTFNYDRVVEYFFFHSIKSYFDLKENETEKIIKEDLNIVHVYGSLGPINGVNSIEFGDFEDSRSIFKASQNIMTFTEGVNEELEMKQAMNWCEDADVLLFLGFAYLPLNLAALKPETAYLPKTVLGTGYGMSSDNLAIAKNILKHKWFGGESVELDIRSVTCTTLLSDVSGLLGEYDLVL